MRRIAIASLLLIACGCGSLISAASAKQVTLLRSEIDPAIEVHATEGDASKFVLHYTRQMPTPGWRFQLDDLRFEEDRIVIELTDMRPEGMVAQVISKGTAKVPLGTLERGRYVVEIRTRRGAEAPYGPAFAGVLIAR